MNELLLQKLAELHDMAVETRATTVSLSNEVKMLSCHTEKAVKSIADAWERIHYIEGTRLASIDARLVDKRVRRASAILKWCERAVIALLSAAGALLGKGLVGGE